MLSTNPEFLPLMHKADNVFWGKEKDKAIRALQRVAGGIARRLHLSFGSGPGAVPVPCPLPA